ncbi:hypothetical protein CW306_12915 [Bacillus sp. BA3]|nr:hypothetical protein CW306_12915 [Bacillus sp. BA3]
MIKKDKSWKHDAVFVKIFDIENKIRQWVSKERLQETIKEIHSLSIITIGRITQSRAISCVKESKHYGIYKIDRRRGSGI